MRKVLFVSPHLDDAVFSCAARILAEKRAGADVTVATVFSHARRRSPAAREYAARREEDRVATQLLGVTSRWMGLLDAPFRNRFYNSFQSIVLETAPGDWENAQLVRGEALALVRELNPDKIYAPLGVGTHIDHRLVFAAMAGLAGAERILYYEDQPYSWVRYSVEMRLNEARGLLPPRSRRSGLNLPGSPTRVAGFLRSFRAAPYVRLYLPPGKSRRHCEQVLGRKLAATPMRRPEWKSEIEVARKSDQARILEALCSYQSQVRPFLGTKRRLIASCASHARGLGVNAWRAERFWMQ